MKRSLLIATTNAGKFQEIKHFLGDLPFRLIGLENIKRKIKAPDESGETIEENALIKARYYAEKTALLTLADDTGLFIPAMHGWPGVKSARIADTKYELRTRLAEEIIKAKVKNWSAIFRAAVTVFDPLQSTTFLTVGKCEGKILKKPRRQESWGYNCIFYVPEIKKTYSEMTTQEKNGVSHRGKALIKIKYYLLRQYGAEHAVVPLGLVIKDGKILLALRHDPFRPEFHRHWEFPGGRMELGERPEENLKREVFEETGYQVEIVKKINYIKVNWREKYNFQVYLMPYVCRITGGEGKYHDAEILDMKFFELNEVRKLPMVGSDPEIFEDCLRELKQIIEEVKL